MKNKEPHNLMLVENSKPHEKLEQRLPSAHGQLLQPNGF